MSFVTDSAEFSPKLPVAHFHFKLFGKSDQLWFRFCSRISDQPVWILPRVTKHFWLYVATWCSQAQFGIWGWVPIPPRHTHPKEYAPLPWTTWHPDIPTHPTRDMRPGIPTRWKGPGTSYTHSPLPREQTDTCENIIFPQLPLVGGRHALSNTLLI